MAHLEDVLHERCEAIVVIEVLHFAIDRQLQVTYELLEGPVEPFHMLLALLDRFFIVSESHMLIGLFAQLSFVRLLHVVLNLGEDAHLVVLGEVEELQCLVFVLAPTTVVLDQVKLVVDQIHDQLAQVIDGDHPTSIRVVLSPPLVEVVACLLSDSQVLLLGRLELTLENDGDEEVEEDERDDEHEADEVDVRDWRATAIDPICLLLLVGLLRHAASEEYVPRASAVVHDRLPILASRDPEKRQERGAEVLEVRMVVQVFLQADAREEEDSEDGEQEEEQEEKCSDVRQLGDRQQECVQDLL